MWNKPCSNLSFWCLGKPSRVLQWDVLLRPLRTSLNLFPLASSHCFVSSSLFPFFFSSLPPSLSFSFYFLLINFTFCSLPKSWPLPLIILHSSTPCLLLWAGRDPPGYFLTWHSLLYEARYILSHWGETTQPRKKTIFHGQKTAFRRAPVRSNCFGPTSAKYVLGGLSPAHICTLVGSSESESPKVQVNCLCWSSWGVPISSGLQSFLIFFHEAKFHPLFGNRYWVSC